MIARRKPPRDANFGVCGIDDLAVVFSVRARWRRIQPDSPARRGIRVARVRGYISFRAVDEEGSRAAG